MIQNYDSSLPFVRDVCAALDASGCLSSVQLTISRYQDGHYEVYLGRTRVPMGITDGMVLGVIDDVPPGQRRATWMLTDAVQLALTNPEAHRLLHW